MFRAQQSRATFGRKRRSHSPRDDARFGIPRAQRATHRSMDTPLDSWTTGAGKSSNFSPTEKAASCSAKVLLMLRRTFTRGQTMSNQVQSFIAAKGSWPLFIAGHEDAFDFSGKVALVHRQFARHRKPQLSLPLVQLGARCAVIILPTRRTEQGRCRARGGAALLGARVFQCDVGNPEQSAQRWIK